MTCKQLLILAIGAGAIFAMPAQGDERNDLWGQGRVEVIFGGGSPEQPCYDCGPSRVPPDRYPVYKDEYPPEYSYPDADWERAKDRAEAQREWEKARREFEREWAKAEREAWKEEQKARREWQIERAKADREAWKEWEKQQRE